MRRREGGREGEVIPRVWEKTVATEGMLGNLDPLGDGPGRSLADHGARVPEVLPAAELEGFLSGAAVGDDVEEAQELAVKAPQLRLLVQQMQILKKLEILEHQPTILVQKKHQQKSLLQPQTV